MIALIQNLDIMMNDIVLLNHNFGNCHIISDEPDLVSGFISALHSFSRVVIGSKIKSINFEDFKFYFYKGVNHTNLLYMFITNDSDEDSVLGIKIIRIADLFEMAYSKDLNVFSGNVTQFKKFKSIITKSKIIDKNCGENETCGECPNSIKKSPVVEVINKNKEEISAWIETVK